MDYIRPTNNVVYYVFYILIYFSCACVFWGQAQIDYINMINNGYINDESISFTLDILQVPLETNKNDFILIQYDVEKPEIKFVNINGNVTLPPILYIEDIQIEYNSDIAIAGKDFNASKIPQNYTVIGYFDTPNSYKLNSEVWLLTSYINLSKGNNFIYITPDGKSMRALEEVFTKNNIRIIQHENHGTYSLKSNKLFKYILYVFLGFLIAAFLSVTYIWISKEKFLINILFLSGTNRIFIFKILFKEKLLPQIIICIFLIIMAICFEQFIYPLWSNDWIFQVSNTFIGLLFFAFILTLILVNDNSIKKGGKKL